MKPSPIIFDRIPGVPESERAIFNARVGHALEDLAAKVDLSDLKVIVQRQNGHPAVPPSDITDDFSEVFASKAPEFSFKRLRLSDDILQRMQSAVATLQYEAKIFDEWGLREIQAHPRTAILLNGPPGTGKTAAAHALADHLGMPILTATTADLESKFLGEGPKLVKAFFAAARKQNALAFLDEADTLLGSRMKVTQGSERAANSMTSQLLIELEKHRGVVVFATNLLDNVDQAFTTRVLRIDIPLPDRAMRKKIWEQHLPSRLPLRNLDLDALADIDGICGRDIRNAVILAASRAALAGEVVAMSDITSVLPQKSTADSSPVSFHSLPDQNS